MAKPRNNLAIVERLPDEICELLLGHVLSELLAETMEPHQHLLHTCHKHVYHFLHTWVTQGKFGENKTRRTIVMLLLVREEDKPPSFPLERVSGFATSPGGPLAVQSHNERKNLDSHLLHTTGVLLTLNIFTSRGHLPLDLHEYQPFPIPCKYTLRSHTIV